jgi:hypothetical protein
LRVHNHRVTADGRRSGRSRPTKTNSGDSRGECNVVEMEIMELITDYQHKIGSHAETRACDSSSDRIRGQETKS